MDKLSIKVSIALIITILLWSSAFVGIRIGLRNYSPGSLALFRYLIASISMIVIYFRLRKRQTVMIKELPLFMLIGVSGFTIYNIALNYGEISIPAGIASFIIGLIPIITMLFAIVFLKEKVSWLGWLGVFISVIGITIIAVGEHAGVSFDYGVMYTLIAAVSMSVYTILQKSLLRKFHPIEVTAFAIWFGTGAMLGFLPTLIYEIPQAHWQITASVIYLGIFPAAIAYVLYSYVLSHLPASVTVRAMYSLPFVTTIMGWLFIGEIPAMLSVIGGMIALMGPIIVNQIRFKTSLKPLHRKNYDR